MVGVDLYDLEGLNYGLNVVGTLDLGIVSTSVTCHSLDFDVGMLTLLKGPRGLCPSYEG